MIIDLENHFSLEEQTVKGTFESGKICERYWDQDGKVMIRQSQDASRIEKYLQFMDDAGIDMAVLTNQSHKLEQHKKWHDICVKLVAEYPKRFTGLATLNPLGGKPALDELERAIKELGLKGVHIWTCNNGTYLDSKDMWPFYEKVSELGIPVDVHITGPAPGFDALQAPYALYYVIAREFDMAAAVLRVCLGGVLEEFPDLVLIMNHFGGGISSVMERLDVYTSYADRPGWPGFYSGKRLISKPWREYFSKLYFNMAGREVGIEALKCALTNISPRKLLFGTDWPWNFDYEPEKVKQYVSEIRKLSLPEEDIEAMLGGNAARLFGIKK
jgi:predicted TIM-barrel fold metal-dependent hydrolase